MAARQNQRWEQNIIFLMHNFIKAVIQAEGGLWVSLIVCDIQENSSFQMPRRALPSARASLPSGFNYQAKGLQSQFLNLFFSQFLQRSFFGDPWGLHVRERVLGAEWHLFLPLSPRLSSPPPADLCMYPVAIRYTQCDLILIMGFSHTLTHLGQFWKDQTIPSTERRAHGCEKKL